MRACATDTREEHALALMDALRKMMLMPARRLEQRVTAMDNGARCGDHAQPTMHSVGIRCVLVNGVAVITGAAVRAGRKTCARAPVEWPPGEP